MKESDAEKEVDVLDYWIGESSISDPFLIRDLKAIRKRLLEPSLGCYHRSMSYGDEGNGQFFSLCNKCGKKVKITMEQFDKSVIGNHDGT
jgi:hypothetical protein